MDEPAERDEHESGGDGAGGSQGSDTAVDSGGTDEAGDPRENGEAAGRGQAALIEGDAEFDARDAALLRAVHEAGSVAGAASDLGRSRARALSRIETLEGAFGTLVDRRRGGSGGGGSRLSQRGRDLLDRYDRLQAVVAATARVPETVLDGEITGVDGELADVDTAVGTVRGLHGGADGKGDAGGEAGGDGHRDEAAVGDPVQVRIGADAVTVYDGAIDVDPNSTSARNRLRGEVVGTEAGETVSTVRVAVDDVTFRVLITAESAARLDLGAGDDVAIRWKATATRIVSGSAASGRK